MIGGGLEDLGLLRFAGLRGRRLGVGVPGEAGNIYVPRIGRLVMEKALKGGVLWQVGKDADGSVPDEDAERPCCVKGGPAMTPSGPLQGGVTSVADYVAGAGANSIYAKMTNVGLFERDYRTGFFQYGTGNPNGCVVQLSSPTNGVPGCTASQRVMGEPDKSSKVPSLFMGVITDIYKAKFKDQKRVKPGQWLDEPLDDPSYDWHSVTSKINGRPAIHVADAPWFRLKNMPYHGLLTFETCFHSADKGDACRFRKCCMTWTVTVNFVDFVTGRGPRVFKPAAGPTQCDE